MTKVLMVGADVHDKSIRVRFGVGRDEPVGKSFGGNKDGRKVLIAFLQGEATLVGATEIVVAYEASSCGYVLYDELRRAGLECQILAPTKIRKSSIEQRNKTDDKDAIRLHEVLKSHVLAGSKLPSIWIPDDNTRDAREVVRCRTDWAVDITSAKNEIQSLLKRKGLEKPDDVGGNWTQAHRRWVKNLIGKKSPLGSGAIRALKSHLAKLEFLEKEARELDRAVAEHSELPQYKKAVEKLSELTGVSILTAMLFLTELGDVFRFNNRRQVGAIMGLAPSSNESGDITDRKGHITRAGSSRLRRLLCQSVWCRVGEGREDWSFYQRLVSRNPKKKKIAVTACMRKLGVKMWHVACEASEKTA